MSLAGRASFKPAVSQGQADMATLPVSVNLDWFYLPVYPLIEHWGPLKTWLLTLGATALLLVLPWLPPRLRGKQPEWSLAVPPDAPLIEFHHCETVLDAGFRQGRASPCECSNGCMWGRTARLLQW